MVLISFRDLYKIHIFPNFHRCDSKNVSATLFWNLNFKWVWQAQFLSHNLLSLQNCLVFTNKEMMLVSFFEINDRIWDKNFNCHCHIHFLSHPCLRNQIISIWPLWAMKAIIGTKMSPNKMIFKFRLCIWEWSF